MGQKNVTSPVYIEMDTIKSQTSCKIEELSVKIKTYGLYTLEVAKFIYQNAEDKKFLHELTVLLKNEDSNMFIFIKKVPDASLKFLQSPNIVGKLSVKQAECLLERAMPFADKNKHAKLAIENLQKCIEDYNKGIAYLNKYGMNATSPVLTTQTSKSPQAVLSR